jgi:hypothetical protein
VCDFVSNIYDDEYVLPQQGLSNQNKGIHGNKKWALWSDLESSVNEAQKVRLWIQSGRGPSGSDKLVVSPEGNIGVGHSDPKAKLHVVGDLIIEGEASKSAGLTVNKDGALITGDTMIAGDLTIGSENEKHSLTVWNPLEAKGSISIEKAHSDDNSLAPLTICPFEDSQKLITFKDPNRAINWEIYQNRNKISGLCFYEMGRDAASLFLGTGGKVGINTDSPKSSLHVAGDLFAEKEANVGSLAVGNGGAHINGPLWVSGSTLNIYPQREGGIYIGNPDTSAQGFTSLSIQISAEKGGHSELQSIKTTGHDWGDLCLNPNNGNVGIGTITPSHKLHVAGDFFAENEANVGSLTVRNGGASINGSLGVSGTLDVGDGEGTLKCSSIVFPGGISLSYMTEKDAKTGLTYYYIGVLFNEQIISRFSIYDKQWHPT